MDRKFGLAEFGKLADEINVGKGDIRTIKVVLAVTGVPNTVVPEVQELIAGVTAKAKALETDVTKILEEDAKDEVKTKATINQIKATRQATKETNARKVAQATRQTSTENAERVRLEKILKKFA